MSILRDLQKDNITNLDEINELLKLEKDSVEYKELETIIKKSPLNITRYYYNLIDKNNINDPIRKIVIPTRNELSIVGSFDTSGEWQNTKEIWLQHKYLQTALLLITNYCSAYCRFCFRKRLVWLTNNEINNNLDKAVTYIKKHKEITNVLVSWWDSFTIDNHIFKKLIDSLTSIKHIQYIRFATRIPVVLPQRIYKDNEFLKLLKDWNKIKKLYVTTHFNNINEITKESKLWIKALLDNWVLINNQTVLMKWVNDTPEQLSILFNKLVEIWVNPYYLFQCRPVRWINHFQIPLNKWIDIVEKAKTQMSWYSKRFKFIMSHISWKIEILWKTMNDNELIFKYHQAKNIDNLWKIFIKEIDDNFCWFDEEKII